MHPGAGSWCYYTKTRDLFKIQSTTAHVNKFPFSYHTGKSGQLGNIQMVPASDSQHGFSVGDHWWEDPAVSARETPGYKKICCWVGCPPGDANSKRAHKLLRGFFSQSLQFIQVVEVPKGIHQPTDHRQHNWGVHLAGGSSSSRQFPGAADLK